MALVQDADGIGRAAGYSTRMAGPSTKPNENSGERVLVPHPNDEADVREGLEQAERGELLSADESAAYVLSLGGVERSGGGSHQRSWRWPGTEDGGTLGKKAGTMERAIIVRGRLSGPRRIDLDEPVDQLSGEVEVFVRSIQSKPADAEQRDIFDVLRSLPPGTRTKEDIDRQIAEERDSWGDR